MFLHGCRTSIQSDSSTPWKELGRVKKTVLEAAVTWNVFETLYIIQTKKFFNIVKWAGPCLGNTNIHSFERCWKSAQHQNEKILRRCKMSWAVTEDVGERGPAINLNVFKWLQKIQTKWFFNAVKGTGPWNVEHGSANDINVFEKVLTIQTKKFFNTVIQAGPCLGEHDQPFDKTLLNIHATPKQNDFSTQRSELSRDRECWGARPSHKLELIYKAAKHPNK